MYFLYALSMFTLYASLIPYAWLYRIVGDKGLWIALVTLIWISALLYIVKKTRSNVVHKPKSIHTKSDLTALLILSAIILYMLRARLYMQILPLLESGEIFSLSSGNTSLQFVFLFFSTLLLLLCAPAVFRLLQGLFGRDVSESMPDNLKESEIPAHIVCLLTAIIVLAFASKSSPLYPINDSVDANCYLTVGKGMLHGLLPYRDLMEQKGPLLYLLHVPAAWIAPQSFFGVYLLEVVFAYAFLWISYRSLRLFLPPSVLHAIPLLAALIYTSPNLMHGSTAEEYSLPFLAYGLYAAALFLRFPKRWQCKHAVLVGICMAAVFWIKYTIVGLFIGWYLFILLYLLRQKEYKGMLNLLLSGLGGALLCSIAVLLYFGMHHAMGDVFQAYFYYNIFYYSAATKAFSPLAMLRNIGRNTVEYLLFNPSTLLMFLGLEHLRRQSRAHFGVFLTAYLFAAFFVFFGYYSWFYYAFALLVFVPFGLLSIHPLMQSCIVKCKKGFARIALYVVYIALTVSILLSGHNVPYMREKKENLAQYIFADIIRKEESPTLLNYGFLDGGFYLCSNVIPNVRYFAALNLELPEVMDTQNEAVANKTVQFIVARRNYYNFEGYHIVASVDTVYEGLPTSYYLYRLEEDAK